MAHAAIPAPTYEPELTGLIIVDPYNDFLSEGGKLYEASRATLEEYDVVEHMRQVLAAARAAQVQVFIAPHHRWREADPYGRWKTMPPIQASTAEAHVFADGTWGGSFHPDFEPRPGEVVAQEHWLSSGFANTDLDLQLKKHGVRELVVIGLRANTCIESTVRFAAELGYEVTLVKDAVGSFSVAEAVIHAPLSAIDLTEWVFTLTDSEYQACSKDHIAGAISVTPDGKRMSINVERVGNLLIEHYIEDVAERAVCRLVSLSDSIGPDINARVKIVVIWTLKVEARETRGVSFAQASELAQRALSAHNAEETPLFAADIGRKARAARWSCGTRTS